MGTISCPHRAVVGNKDITSNDECFNRGRISSSGSPENRRIESGREVKVTIEQYSYIHPFVQQLSVMSLPGAKHYVGEMMFIFISTSSH